MKKEFSMEARLLLAFVLMGAVIWVTPYFIKTPPPQPKAGDSKTATTDSKTAPKETAKADAPAAEPPAKPAAKAPAKPVKSKDQPAAAVEEEAAKVQADAEETTVVDTDVFHIEFSNRGAVARQWVLKNFKDKFDKPLNLATTAPPEKVAAPFALHFKGTAPPSDLNAALYRLQKSDDGLNLSFEFSDGHTTAKKTFHFFKKSYLLQVTSEVMVNGALAPHSITWRGGFGDPNIANPANSEHSLFYDLAETSYFSSNPKTNDVKAAKNGPISNSGNYSFVGLEDSYFVAAFLPEGRGPVEITTLADAVPMPNGTDEQRVGAAVGGEGRNVFELYVGPKDLDLLGSVNPKLEQVVDWGWYAFIAKPLFFALTWAAHHVVQNYGVAIVLVTILINLLLFPLRFTSLKSSRKMQQLKPQIDAINAKYKNLSLRDPKKQEQNQEMMDLYKANGVNPVGGCLPMVIQIPFLFAFYKVLTLGIQMRGAHFLWITDLSQPEALHLLTILLIVTQFLSQRMTPSPGMDPAQQKMMLIMPLFFGFMFWYYPAGLVLYWLTGNLVSIVQQVLLNRTMPKPAVIDLKPVSKKKK
jgi:YidC/Oxa1 family membrane protein insertase